MGTQKMQDILTWKLKALEAQILDLKKKQESQVQLLKQKKKKRWGDLKTKTLRSSLKERW